MLTGSCSRGYLTKFLLPFLLIGALFIFSLSLIFNIILSASKNTLIEAANRYFIRKVSVERIFFVPPNFIFLKDSSITEDTVTGSGPFMAVPLARARVSWGGLIKDRRLRLDQICFYNPKIDPEKAYAALAQDFKAIIEFIRRLPRQDIALVVKSAQLAMDNRGKGNHSRNNLSLTIRGNSFFGSGSSAGSGSKRRRPSLQYAFRGDLASDGLKIRNLEFKREDLYLDLWGELRGNALALSGYSFLKNASFKGRSYRYSRRERSLQRLKKISPIPFDLSWARIYVPDIDCRINFELPTINIEYLNCSINDNPVAITGRITFSNPVSFDARLSCRLENIRQENLKRIEMTLGGNIRQGAINGQAKIDMGFSRKKEDSAPLERLTVDFKDLGLSLEVPKGLKMRSGAVDLFSLTRSNTYKVSLNDFNAAIYFKDRQYKLIEFDSGFYGGRLKGEALADVRAFPVKVSSDIEIEGARAERMEGLLAHFSKVFGRLSSLMRFSTYPEMALKGNMVIEDGYLNNFEFFRWLADYFALESLKRIDFRHSSLSFTVDSQGARLEGIALDSRDADIRGYFGLGQGDLVCGRLALTMESKLLEGSPRFRPLFRILGRGASPLIFNFQLSGPLQRMNFQWLESELKKKLEDSIPDFIERHIEKKIEGVLDSAS